MSGEQSPEKGQAASVGSSAWFGLAAKYFTPPFRHEDGIIWGSGEGAERMLDIRGWGHLTGTGAHGLPADKAAAIQDQIGDHLAELLNAHWPNAVVRDGPLGGRSL